MLKPAEMRANPPLCWPASRLELHRATIRLFSLHHLPTRGERRPDLRGEPGLGLVRELTGERAPPVIGQVSSPSISIELFPIGGFASVSSELPPQGDVKTSASTVAVEGNGFNAHGFGGHFHCLAGEPMHTILRVSVWDDGQMVAYSTVVLGVLRAGYRVLRLRDRLGTPIELCSIFLHVALGTEENLYGSTAELQKRVKEQQLVISQHESQQVQLEEQVSDLSSKNSVLHDENSQLRDSAKASKQRSRRAARLAALLKTGYSDDSSALVINNAEHNAEIAILLDQAAADDSAAVLPQEAADEEANDHEDLKT